MWKLLIGYVKFLVYFKIFVMENSKEVVEEEFVRRETVTESDAVHPRFIKEDPEEIREYELHNYYFCQQCNIFFAPTVQGLKTHFKGDIVRHEAIGSCFYCKGKVYEYSLDNKLRVYHNCKDKDKDC